MLHRRHFQFGLVKWRGRWMMHYNAVFIFICFDITFVRCPFNCVWFSDWSTYRVEFWFHRYATSKAKQKSSTGQNAFVSFDAQETSDKNQTCPKRNPHDSSINFFFLGQQKKNEGWKIASEHNLSSRSLLPLFNELFSHKVSAVQCVLFSCWGITGSCTGTRRTFSWATQPPIQNG